MKDPEKVKQGKANQRKGNEFENKTREDLESKGWVVSRWCNNVDLTITNGKLSDGSELEEHDIVISEDEVEKYKQKADLIPCSNYHIDVKQDGWNVVEGELGQIGKRRVIVDKGKLIPARQGRFRKVSTGFPDFIAYSRRGSNASISTDEQTELDENDEYLSGINALIFVECKAGKYLKAEEKEKAKWYLKNNYCDMFLVAYKEIDRNDLRKRKVSYYEITSD